MNLVDKVINVVAPNQCVACGIEGQVLCGDCLLAAGSPLVPRCSGCKTLTEGSRTCSSCLSWLPVRAVYVATEYDGMYEKLLRAYKFDVRRQAVHPIAQMLSAAVPRFESPVTACPLPTAPARIRARGFDHANMLTKEFVSLRNDITSTTHVLRRRTNSRQLGSSRAQRMQQMQDEFYVIDVNEVKGKTFLLVDDVVTTGASIAAAAKTLKQAGANRVYAAIFAQKV
jgi:ComF family protein